jgi:hypothetical protein
MRFQSARPIGTFTGEIERKLDPIATAAKKNAFGNETKQLRFRCRK